MLCYLAMIDTPENRDKFEMLYEKYKGLMLYVANKLLSCREDAEDAVHQAFLSVIENLHKIGEIDCPQTRSFLVIIVERKAIDLLRKRRPTLSLNEEIAGLPFEAPVDNPLARGMGALPAHYRQVLLLRYDNGYSSREIAAMLGMSLAAVRKQLTRGKQLLRQILEKEGVVL